MGTMNEGQLRGKLYTLQIFYWMAFCAISGFATVFLISKNISSSQIGIIIAIGSILSVVMQFFTADIIKLMPGMTVRKFMTCLFLIGGLTSLGVLIFNQNNVVLACLYCLLFIILYTTQPLVTTLIYEYANQGLEIVFASTRGVGSLVYALTSFVLGLWLERSSSLSLPTLFSFALFVLTILLVSMPEVSTANSVDITKELHATSLLDFPRKYPGFLFFVSALVLIFGFHTLTNVYLPQMVQAVGGGNKQIGFAIALAGLCELPTMLGFKKLEDKINVVMLLRIAVVFFVVKALIYVWASSFIGIQLSQLLQMFSFALITPAYAHYVNELMTPVDRIKGQTFVMAGVTLGNVLGSLAGGFILDVAPVKVMLQVGLGLTILGMTLALFSLKGKEKALLR